MQQIHIIDGQSHEILDFITAKNIILDSHKKSLETLTETYEFTTFTGRRASQFLEERNRIIIPDEDGNLVEFVISKAVEDSKGRETRVLSLASYSELRKSSVIYPGTFEGNGSQHLGFGLNDSGWTPGIVETKGTRTLTRDAHTNPLDYIKLLVTEFEVEARFRIEHDGNKITGRYVDLLERVGAWRGREVEFGKDLDGIRRVEKQDIVTALLGLGPEDENGQRLEVLVEDNEALQRWGRIDEHGNLKHLIEPYEIQSERSEMTLAEARQYTRTALDKRINTQVTFETTFIDLENVPGMENKKVRFGDTIKIKDTTFNPPLYLEARVFEQDRSIKSKAKKDIKLGDYIEHTEEEVNAIWKQLQKQIQNRVSYYEMVEHTYDRLTIDNKDETVFTEGKTFAEAVGLDAKAYAEAQDELIKVDVENYAESVAQSALDQAKMYAVAQEVYDIQMNQIASDLADRTTIEYVDGQLVDKANVGDVYTISDVDNMINNTVSVTQYTTDMNGIVTDLESQGTRIGQNETAIGFRATTEDLNAVEGTLSTAIGNVDIKADGIIQSVESIETSLGDLDGQVTALDGSISTLAGEVSLKASQSIVDSLEGRVSTAEGTLDVLPGQINAKVSKDGIIGAINLSPETTLIQAKNIDLQGYVTADDLEVRGDLKFGGILEGASGTFSGDLEGSNITGSYFRMGEVITGDDEVGIYGLHDYNEAVNAYNAKDIRGEMLTNGAYISFNSKVKIQGTGTEYWSSTHYGSSSLKMRAYDNSSNNNFDGAFSSLRDRLDISPSAISLGKSGSTTSPLWNNDIFIRSNGTIYAKEYIETGELFTNRGRIYGQADNFFFIGDEYVGSASIYSRTSTATSNMLRVTGSGTINRSTSSRRFKLVEEVVDLKYAKRILDLNAVTWFDKRAAEDYCHTLTTGEETEVQRIERIGGVIAEDAHDLGLGTYISYDDIGRPDGIHANLWTLLIPITKDHEIKLTDLEVGLDDFKIKLTNQEKKIISLEDKVEKLENEVQTLKGVA